MKRTNHILLIICILCIANSSCKTNLLVLEDLVPTARQHNLDVLFDQSSLKDFEVGLVLSYEYRNPYKKDLPLPDHAMGIKLNKHEETSLFKRHEAVSIPAKSSRVLDYSFNLDFATLKSLMGKNNEITFHASFEIDLSEFSDMLPNYQVSISKDFDLETSDLKPMFDKLLKKRIGTYDLILEHTTFLKIPALPTITSSTEPIEILLLGDGIELISPNDIKNALIPFGDLLINGELDGIKDPFIKAIVDATVTVPAPTITDWTRTEDVKMEEQVINLLTPLDENIDDKWEDIKSKLYQSTTLSASDYIVDNILDPYIDPLAAEKWDGFQIAYNNLKTTTLPDEIPGPQTYGFQLSIPFSFTNNNNFPIHIPILKSSVHITDGQPFTIYIKPKNMQDLSSDTLPESNAVVAANQAETMYVVFEFNMQAFNQGIYSLFMKNQFEPNLKGIMSYDFGYGPMYVGYNLQEMQLHYK